MSQQIKFDSKKCSESITKLKSANQSLNDVVVTRLTNLMADVEAIYDSQTSRKMLKAYDDIKTNYKNYFEKALNDAIAYLENDVMTKLIELENAASNAIQD